MTSPDPLHRLPFFERFGVDRSTAGRVLREALASGGDHADLFFEYHQSGGIGLEDGRVKEVRRNVDCGCGVRVLKGEATGYAYTEDLSLEGLLGAARTASAVASGGGARAGIELKGVSSLDLYPVARPLVDVDAVEKLALLRRADDAARAASEHVVRVSASIADSLREILVVTSDGRYASDRQPMLRFNVGVVVERDGMRETAGQGGGGRVGLDYFVDHPPEALARDAVRIAETMLGAEEAPAGSLPVVLAPGDSGILLHEAVGHGLEADFNRKKTSNYSDRIGERVASPGCTVVDDGTLHASRGSINIDDEGFAPQRNVLIEDGILRAYMQDELSSRFFPEQGRGNGRRQDFRHVPLPRMTNTCMLAGEYGADEIIASVKRGIFARTFSGGQVNISNGDFVFSVTEGYLIEDGKITRPVKGVNLIGNGPDALNRVSMVGSDFALSDGRWTCGKDGQSVPVGVGTPTVKIDALTVGGSRA